MFLFFHATFRDPKSQVKTCAQIRKRHCIHVSQNFLEKQQKCGFSKEFGESESKSVSNKQFNFI